MESDAGAVALGRSEPASVVARTGSRARLARENNRRNNNTTASTQEPRINSLVSLCRTVVVSSLEKYSPDSFQVLSEQDFAEIVQLRHERTAPKEGMGGLDGTGRVVPALSDKFLTDVERVNPHLSESVVVDRLVWKDCVNFRFREGGLTRPVALALPWPLLVEKIRSSADALLVSRGETAAAVVASLDTPGARDALQALEQCPMNVPLLQATGVGKAVRKCIKAHRNQSNPPIEEVERLERLLNSWMDVAEKNSAAVAATTAAAAAAAKSGSTNSIKDAERDLKIAETCQSWRQLFCALKDRADSCRTVQGERMRKIRNNLARDRPKVVKVRPASSSAKPSARLLSRIEEGKVVVTPSPSSSSTANSSASKMSKLWRETAVAAQRSQRPSGPTQPVPMKRAPTASSSSFGAAVAFAASSKRPAKQSAKPSIKAQSKLVSLSGGKMMRVPKHNPSAVAATTASRVCHAASRPSSSSTSTTAPPAKFRRTGHR